MTDGRRGSRTSEVDVIEVVPVTGGQLVEHRIVPLQADSVGLDLHERGPAPVGLVEWPRQPRLSEGGEPLGVGGVERLLTAGDVAQWRTEGRGGLPAAGGGDEAAEEFAIVAVDVLGRREVRPCVLDRRYDRVRGLSQRGDRWLVRWCCRRSSPASPRALRPIPPAGAVMSLVGSPLTRTRSAREPIASRPRSGIPKVSAGADVAAVTRSAVPFGVSTSPHVS